jgi:tetratricopeptide (TPR) repeat protein
VNETEILQSLQTGYALLQQGDIAGARQRIDPIVRAFPERVEATHLLGLVQRAAGDLESARASLARAVALGGGAPEIRNTLGNLLEDMGRLDEADAEFDAATRQAPEYAPPWINRGRLASKRGQHERAISLLEQAAAIDAKSALPLISLGNAYRNAGQSEKAVTTLRQAVVRNPAHPTARLHLAAALRDAGRSREAIAEYDAAERAGQMQPQLLKARAGAWIALGDIERARSDLDRLTSQYPGQLDGHQDRAQLYWEYSLAGDPFESYRKAVEMHPREPAVWAAWLGTLARFRRFEQLVEVAEAANRAVGFNPDRTFAMAMALSELGRVDEADRAFAAVILHFSDDAGALATFARHLLRRGDPERAAETAQRSAELMPDGQFAYAYLGLAWRMMDDPREYWLLDYERHAALVDAAPDNWDGTAAQFAAAATPVLRGLHTGQHHPPDQSLRHGTQTSGQLFDRPEPEIAAIRSAVLNAVRGFAARLPNDPRHPFLRRKAEVFAFTGSWSVRLTRQGFHVNHVHNLGWLSSAFYFHLPPPDPADPAEAGWLQLGQPPEELGLELRPRRLIQPVVGKLALFPSYMWHGTVPFESEGERLTAAFDITPASGLSG